MSNICTRTTARPGSVIRRRAGSGGALRSAACPRSVARDAARLARQQWRSARRSQARLRLHQAERRRPGRARRLLLRIRSTAGSSISAWCSPAISKHRCSTQPPHRRCRSTAGQDAAGKGLSQLRDGIREDAAPVMVQLFGPEDAGYLLHLTGKLIGMQYLTEIARAFLVTRAVRRSLPRSCVCCSTARTSCRVQRGCRQL